MTSKREPRSVRIEYRDRYVGRTRRIKPDTLRYILGRIRESLGLPFEGRATITICRAARGAWKLEPNTYDCFGLSVAVLHRGLYVGSMCAVGFRRITGMRPEGRFSVAVKVHA